MKKRLLQYLACPECGGDLRLLSVAKEDNGEILEGDLDCVGCLKHFPVVRGVPRFAELDKIEEDKAATASSFGWEWQHFTQEDERYGEQIVVAVGNVELVEEEDTVEEESESYEVAP